MTARPSPADRLLAEAGTSDPAARRRLEIMHAILDDSEARARKVRT